MRIKRAGNTCFSVVYLMMPYLPVVGFFPVATGKSCRSIDREPKILARLDYFFIHVRTNLCVSLCINRRIRTSDTVLMSECRHNSFHSCRRLSRFFPASVANKSTTRKCFRDERSSKVSFIHILTDSESEYVN